MLNRRPKVGLLFLAGDSWWEAGCCGAESGPYKGFLENIESDCAAALSALKTDYDVVSAGLLHTTDQVIAEAKRFNEEDVDAIVFCPIIWTNDPPVVAFIQAARHVPLLLWAYDPYEGFPDYFRIEEWLRASGPVSVQQSANIFRRYGWEYEVAFGNQADEEAIGDIKAFVRAAAVKRSLRGTRIAMMPGPCRVVISTWVDEFRLLEKFGVELEYLPIDRFAQWVKAVPDSEAAAYVDWLKARCMVVDTPNETLHASAKQAVAMVRMADEHGLSGIALEDFNEDIYRVLGFRPHLYHPRLGELGCTVGLEADVPGVLATIITGRLAGHMGMFNEFYSIDRRANTVLMGHPGMGELSMGEPDTFTVTPDLEFDETQPRGAWVSYRAKAGPMTFLNITPEYGRLKTAVWRGECLPGPRLMEGYAHMLVRPEGNAMDLFKRVVDLGLIQHWGTVHGDVTRSLSPLMRMLGLELTRL